MTRPHSSSHSPSPHRPHHRPAVPYRRGAGYISYPWADYYTYNWGLGSQQLGWPWSFQQARVLPSVLGVASTCYLPNGACVDGITPQRCVLNGGVPDQGPCSFTGQPPFLGQPWWAQ